MIRSLVYFSLLFTLFAGCKKGRADFTLRGVIMDDTFGGGLSGGVINLYEVEAGGFSTTLIGTAQLTDGNYSFTFPRNKAESYTVEVIKDNYFTLNESVNFSDLTIESDNYRDYRVPAKSWVRLRFINDNPQPTDVLKYIKIDGKQDCPECCPKTEQFLNGAIDTTIVCINNANTIYSYNYWVLNTVISGNRSVLTLPFDTVDLVLNY
jgi:hypothetical protein